MQIVSNQRGSDGMTEVPRIPPEKAKEMQERARERNLIIKELKDQGPRTLDELSKVTGIDKEKLFKHVIAMRQFGKLAIAGERDNQLVYGLPEGE
jgi:predicted transcriptional regulator